MKKNCSDEQVFKLMSLKCFLEKSTKRIILMNTIYIEKKIYFYLKLPNFTVGQ